jgi:hypothetical protein
LVEHLAVSQKMKTPANFNILIMAPILFLAVAVLTFPANAQGKDKLVRFGQ